MIIAKIARNQTLASLYPNRILSLHINGSVLDKETQHSVLKYLAVYVLIILSLVTVLSLDNHYTEREIPYTRIIAASR